MTYLVDAFMGVLASRLVIAIQFGSAALPGAISRRGIYWASWGTYLLLAEWLPGRSLGKLLAGTRVVDAKGKRPAFWRILVRTACRFIPFEGITIFGPQRQCLHDFVSGTRVVDIGKEIPFWRKPIPGLTLTLPVPEGDEDEFLPG